MAALLEGRRVTRYFGGLAALRDVDFELTPGEILGLVGPNGAGKTTLINVISGQLSPSGGDIRYKGRSIGGWPAHRVAQLGVARTFQLSRTFLGMTVEENVKLGALFGTLGEAGARPARLRRVGGILDLLALGARRHDRVQVLNVADRRRVDLARALAMDPEILLLDEPMAGLNPIDLEGLVSVVREIARRGISVIIIEHIMKVIVDLCHRALVLHHGQKLAEGTTEEVLRDRSVIDAYLGRRRPVRDLAVGP